MEIVSTSPLRAGLLVWQRRPREWILTVYSKATYDLAPGESPLASEQEELQAEDSYWQGEPSRSLYAPADAVPLKPRADVVLVGSAFAPGGAPVRSLVARLIVAEINKSIEVFGARALAPDGALQQGEPFAEMALAYEGAAGGPGTRNPVGIGLGARDPYGRRLLPHFQSRGMKLARPDMPIEPIGFGPIAPSWPERIERLGRHAAIWSPRDWPSRPLPEGFDLGYFNVAPRDQQVAALRDDECIVLENLHREHRRLVTKLPGIRPAVFVEGRGPATRTPMRADTLWIDTTRGRCALTFRGELGLDRPDEELRIVAGMESAGQEAGTADVEHTRADRPRPMRGPGTGALHLPDPEDATRVGEPLPAGRAPLPFAPAGSPGAGRLEDPASWSDGALPFVPPPAPAPPVPPAPGSSGSWPIAAPAPPGRAD
ncbi:MAG: DUF2169 domain-containing protein, partial [Deltaproteobacteria bacterium]|nr:DUF2169 domain-containing protein [Deltaproteobacteria bacterium]